MTTVAVIQARMSSTRLPGKVTLPLDGRTVIERVVRRVAAADAVDVVVVAAPDLECDDVVAFFAERAGARVHRGPHEDVLTRLYDAAVAHDADTVVRVSADSPLLLPAYVDHALSLVESGAFDYVTDALERTFPLGVACEVFSRESFETVQTAATTSEQREHVTAYYRENRETFDVRNVTSSEPPFPEEIAGRTDLRFTLDRAADYDLIRRIYENVAFDDFLHIGDAVPYVDDTDLVGINGHVAHR
jgi:spore coat polysaccharide biosynthesis protein SpsF